MHYLRTEAPLTPEVLSTYSRRLDVNRANPYFKPGGYSAADLRAGYKSFETRQCSTASRRSLPPRDATIADPAFNIRTDGDVERRRRLLRPDQAVRVQRSAIDRDDRGAGRASKQTPFESIGSPSETSDFLHVYPQP